MPIGLLTSSSTIAGAIETTLDKDFFKAQLIAGKRYIFEISSAANDPSALSYPDIVLLDANGNPINTERKEGTQFTRIMGLSPESGDYFIATNGRYGYSGTYSLKMAEATGFGSTVAVSGTSVVEGNIGQTEAQFKVTRSGEAGEFSVNYRTRPSYTGEGDFTSTSGILHFAEGETEKTFSVFINGDSIHEDDENFTVELFDATLGATISRDTASAVIYDDDSPDDYADSLENSGRPYGLLDVGARLAGVLDDSRDKDTFSVELTAGIAYSFSYNGFNPQTLVSTDTRLSILDVNGAHLYPTDFGANLERIFIPSVTGRYYIQIGDDYNFDLGAYVVSENLATGYGSSVSISDATVVEGNEGTSQAVMTVTRTGGSGEFDVDFRVYANSSIRGPIILAPPGLTFNPRNRPSYVDLPSAIRQLETLHFAEGENSKQILLSLEGDTLPESDELFSVVLSNSTRGATIADSTGKLTIFDDDQPDDYANQLADPTAPVGQLSVNYPTYGWIEYAFDRDLFSVHLEAGVAYAIGMGGPQTSYETLKSPRFSILDSIGNEIVRSAYVDQWTTAQQFIPDSSGTYYISAEGVYSYDSRFQGKYGIIVEAMTGIGSTISIADAASVTEGNDGTRTLTYAVTRSGASGAVLVTYSTLPYASYYNDPMIRDATAGSDFSAKSGVIEFAQGETTKEITVTISGDASLEYDEAVGVQLVRASGGATLGDAYAYGLILNDDDQEDFADSLDDRSNPIGVLPADGRATGVFELDNDRDVFAVELSAGQTYVFSQGVPGQDFISYWKIGLLTDHGTEITDSFGSLTYTATTTGTFYLFTEASIFSTGTYQLTADRLEAKGSRVSIADASVTEGDTGTKLMTFTVTRTGGTGAFDVNYSTLDMIANHSALEGSDYRPASGTLSFSATEISKTISVEIISDTVLEENEKFAMYLSNATEGAQIQDSPAYGSILNDEPVPDDYADSVTDSSHPIGLVPIGQAILRKLELNGDADVFEARLEAGAVYFFQPIYLSNGASRNPAFEIYGANGESVEWIHLTSNLGSVNPFKAPTDGTYYFKVQGGADGASGDYQIYLSAFLSNASDSTLIQHANVAWHGLYGNDQIDGSDLADEIHGDAGNDFLDGRYGADFLYGGTGNDKIYFDMSDSAVDGGEGYDVAVYQGAGSARPGLAELRRKSFEIIDQNTERVVFDLFPGNYFMDATANGTFTEKLFERPNVPGPLDIRTTFFDQFKREELVEFRTGSFDGIVYDYDPSDAASWSRIIDTYVFGGKSQTDIYFDDGARVLTEFDPGLAYDWKENVSVYATGGALDFNDRRFDDGSRLISDSDQANALAWSSATTRFSAPGAVDYQDYVYDDGRRIIYDNDDANVYAWAQRITVYAADGSYDYQDTRFDDGRRVVHDSDNGDASSVWDIWESYFDAGGKLTTQRVTWDDGSVRIFNL